MSRFDFVLVVIVRPGEWRTSGSRRRPVPCRRRDLNGIAARFPAQAVRPDSDPKGERRSKATLKQIINFFSNYQITKVEVQASLNKV